MALIPDAASVGSAPDPALGRPRQDSEPLGGQGAALGAVLFDLDGTLIDSMPLHQRSWRLWHAELGLAFDETGFFEATAGRTNLEILKDLFPGRAPTELEAMAERKEALYREIAATELQLIPGAEAVCRAARLHGLKLAVCTASPPQNIAIAFERFGMAGWVDTVASPADGLRGKPHPDIFLAAADRLGVPSAACLVFEDAPLGIEAARRAGMRAVALTTTLPAEAFAGYPNLVSAMPDFIGYALPFPPQS
jgi:HAD superfamily hydrolase (TIGR01509 family)